MRNWQCNVTAIQRRKPIASKPNHVPYSASHRVVPQWSHHVLAYLTTRKDSYKWGRENILFIFRYTVWYPAQLVLAECVRWKLINEWINQWQHKHGWHCASWLSSSESKHRSERGYAVAYKQGCFWLFPLKKQWTSVAQTREQPGGMPNTSTLFLSTSLRPGCSAHVKLTTGEISWHFFFFLQPPTSLLLLAQFMKGAKEKWLSSLHETRWYRRPLYLVSNPAHGFSSKPGRNEGQPWPSINKINFCPDQDKIIEGLVLINNQTLVCRDYKLLTSLHFRAMYREEYQIWLKDLRARLACH